MFEFLKNLVNPRKTPKYILVEKKIGEDFVQGVKIMSGPYSGLVFTTEGQVKFKPEGENVKLDYSYIIRYKPESIPDYMLSPEKLDHIIGDIIVDIVSENYKEPLDQ